MRRGLFYAMEGGGEEWGEGVVNNTNSRSRKPKDKATADGLLSPLSSH
jgi:hypothetical protein